MDHAMRVLGHKQSRMAFEFSVKRRRVTAPRLQPDRKLGQLSATNGSLHLRQAIIRSKAVMDIAKLTGPTFAVSEPVKVLSVVLIGPTYLVGLPIAEEYEPSLSTGRHDFVAAEGEGCSVSERTHASAID